MLSSHFVGLRKQVQQVEQDNDERSSIPITIRSDQFYVSYFFAVSNVVSLANWRQLFAFLSRWQR